MITVKSTAKEINAALNSTDYVLVARFAVEGYLEYMDWVNRAATVISQSDDVIAKGCTARNKEVMSELESYADELQIYMLNYLGMAKVGLESDLANTNTAKNVLQWADSAIRMTNAITSLITTFQCSERNIDRVDGLVNYASGLQVQIKEQLVKGRKIVNLERESVGLVAI